MLGDLRVPMRDGVTLATDVYLPAGEDGRPAAEAFPAVLIRMPYGIRESYAYMPAVGRYWARRGYACVVQDVRGKFGSEGEWDPFVHEVDDGYDAVDWVARQPWCDGRVGMTGESYFAFTQWAAAASRHPALRCISPGDMGVRHLRADLRGWRARAVVDRALGLRPGAAPLHQLAALRHSAPAAGGDGEGSRPAQPALRRADRASEPRRLLGRYDLREVLRTVEIPVLRVERLVRQHAPRHAGLLGGDGGRGRGDGRGPARLAARAG